ATVPAPHPGHKKFNSRPVAPTILQTQISPLVAEGGCRVSPGHGTRSESSRWPDPPNPPPTELLVAVGGWPARCTFRPARWTDPSAMPSTRTCSRSDSIRVNFTLLDPVLIARTFMPRHPEVGGRFGPAATAARKNTILSISRSCMMATPGAGPDQGTAPLDL